MGRGDFTSSSSTMTKRRAIDADERALWQAAMRGVTRHRAGGKKASIAPNDSLSVPLGGRGQGEVGLTTGAAIPPPRLTSPPPRAEREKRESEAGIDRRQALRLKRGQLPIEARLDLHGMTQGEAHRELAAFVARNHAAGKRVLLIVTGKGTREGSGVLRAAVPRWLAEPALRPAVLTTASAVPRDGGDGARYLLLRRAR
jgi:DNA-nicking Smr family endonuclease